MVRVGAAEEAVLSRVAGLDASVAFRIPPLLGLETGGGVLVGMGTTRGTAVAAGAAGAAVAAGAGATGVGVSSSPPQAAATTTT